MTCPASLNNRLAILDGYAAQGLTVRLDPDTASLQWRKIETLEPWQREHLKEYRAGFAEALRYRAGLCVTCGLDAATRPTTLGCRRAVVDGQIAWVEADAPPDLKARLLPPLFCELCWDAGAYFEFCWGMPRNGARIAGSTQAGRGEPDDLFDGIGCDDDAEPVFAFDPA